MSPRRPKVSLLTTVDFWEPGSGHRARILALVQALAGRTELTVLMPMALDAAARAQLAGRLPQVRLHTLDLPESGQASEALAAVATFFREWPQDACIVEFLRLAWLVQAVPPGVLKLIDTHAVASEHDAALARLRQGGKAPAFTDTQERRMLAAFDRVIAICEPDAAVFAGWLGPGRVLLAPHAQAVQATPVRDTLEQMLVVAGDYPPNREGLHWLLGAVWPRLAALHPTLVLHIVGTVGPAMGLRDGDRLRVHGRVDDLAAHYAAADLCLNPVRVGAGLKIKTVEALAHGRPLLSTLHGVRSLEAHAGEAFLVADTPEGFEREVAGLLAAPQRCHTLAAAAVRLAQARFSEAACYGPLFQALQA